jgi:hypothetical protein
MSRASRNSTREGAHGASSAAMRAPHAPHAAFVVHLREGTPVTASAMYGRVEHVATGAATAFASLEEVRAFMERVLADHGRKAERCKTELPTEELALDRDTTGPT